MSQSGKTHKVDMKVVTNMFNYPMDNSTYAPPTGEVAGRSRGDANKELRSVTPAKGTCDGAKIEGISSIQKG